MIICLPAVALLAVVAFLISVTVVSGNINAERQTKICTVTDVAYSPTKSGAPAWSIGTTCGGTLYIDAQATAQTNQQASSLAGSLKLGKRYVLKIQGDLANKFTISSYLLSATPVN